MGWQKIEQDMLNVEIISHKMGILGANCYLVMDSLNQVAAVIDPVDKADKIFAQAENLGVTIKMIINTHGHWDHIGANKTLQELCGAPVYMHEAEKQKLQDGTLNGFFERRGNNLFCGYDKIYLKDGDKLTLGSLELQVIHTPGHSPGGLCLLVGNVIFTGDTLFEGSIGRTDFPGGDYDTLIKSIKNKLLPLPDELMILPGHGMDSNLGREKAHNPYLRNL